MSSKKLNELLKSYFKKYWRPVEVITTRLIKIPDTEEPFVGEKRIADICWFWTQTEEKEWTRGELSLTKTAA